MIDWPITFSIVVRQHFMTGACAQENILTSWPGRREGKKEKGDKIFPIVSQEHISNDLKAKDLSAGSTSCRVHHLPRE